MKLNDRFTRRVYRTSPAESLAAVARSMQEHNIGAMVVVEDGRPVGIITDRDLALALGTQSAGLNSPVRDVMSPHVVAIPEDTEIDTASRFMKESQVRRLPIVDREDRVVGIVTLDDLLRHAIREMRNLADAIEPEMQVR